MAIELTDDGTMGTVLRCSECGAEMRYNYDPCEQWDDTEDGKDPTDQECEAAYDAWIDDCIEDATADHDCDCWCVYELMTLDYLERPYEVIDRPLWWHRRGLSQTASGYGRKLTSARIVRLPDGRERRIYVTCFSNSGTAWIIVDGKHLIVRD